MRHSLLLATALPIVLTACDRLFGVAACPTDFQYAIEVSLIDATTSRVLDGVDASGALGYQGQTLPLMPGTSDERGHILTLAGGGRAGLYDVMVEKPGFQRWSTTGIRAENTSCGVVTKHVDARLQPATRLAGTFAPADSLREPSWTRPD